MSKLIFSGTINENLVLRDEINARFTDIANKVGTAKLDFDQFREKSLRYRHLDRPPVRFLWHESEGALIGGALTKVGVWNATSVQLININHTAAYAPGDGVAIAVYAEYEATDWEPYAYEIAIGYRHSGTWYHIPGTERTLGYMHANVNASAYVGLANHYYTGVATSWRPTGSHNQPVVGTCSVVTDSHLGVGHTIGNIDRYSVLIRVNNGDHNGGTQDINIWDKARIWAVIKDTV